MFDCLLLYSDENFFFSSHCAHSLVHIRYFHALDSIFQLTVLSVSRKPVYSSIFDLCAPSRITWKLSISEHEYPKVSPTKLDTLLVFRCDKIVEKIFTTVRYCRLR
ncbi:hypothetical protein RvY_19342 [Ramazzottius varieornatus]|uniref:Uncharacterized protein n=1 Tax=Ramazzottius varieornatus TaxID=947166 RepID=A0A1D1W931_RAMVA|nr:hypothetical protein RvY_19342 [Ramazzottius varieornatus]